MLADEIKDAIDKAVFEALSKIELRAGTVVTSPFENTDDAMTVQFDGSSVATPVKLIRAFPVFPGYRVALARFGSEWTCVGAFTDPAAGTGAMRMTLGADVPSELQGFGIGVAMLFYVTEVESGVEKGYFFIGLSNTLDVGNQEVCLFGRVLYPTPGDPSSPTSSDVDTNFQMNLDPGFTVFKDYPITVQGSVGNITLANGVELFLSGNRVTSSQNGVNDAATTGGANNDTTSATFTNMGGTGSVTSFSFDKKFNATRIKVTMHASMFALTSTSDADIGVLIDSVDYKVSHGTVVLNERGVISGVEYISGVNAGVYTVQGRWMRRAGTGTLRRDSNDWLCIIAEEVV